MHGLILTWNVSSDLGDDHILEVLKGVKGEELNTKTNY